MFESDLPVTRLTIPPLRSTLLPRARLLLLLDQGRSVPLTLLLASAGFGKTTLLSTWARQSTGQIAWLTLDDQDNDPTRFWACVIAALRKAGSPAGEAALALLYSPQPPRLNSVLTALINELTALAQEMVLIMDDYHLVSETAIHESLQFFLQHLPSCLHLYLSSRADPPFPLARLRARGQVVEIREPELRLSNAETARFLEEIMGLTLSTEDIQRLEQRTEGWLAGLQLAALSLQRHRSVTTFLETFAGSHRFVLDYVQEEILDALPEQLRRFLLQTSVLDRMTADLCRALTGEQDSQQTLEALERAHLFLIPLDEERRCYRFHPLFREVLLARLQSTQPEQVHRLHREAALWYQRQGWPHEAIFHAKAAQDFFFMAELLENYTERLFLQGELQTLLSWIKQLPQDVLQAHPRLATSYILAFSLLFPFPHQQQEERRYVQQVQQGVESLVQGKDATNLSQAERDLLQRRIALLKIWERGARALSEGDVGLMSRFAELAQRLSLEDDAMWGQYSLGSLAMASRLAGNFPPMVAALQESRKSLQQARDRAQEIQILWVLVVALIALGQLSRARDTSEDLRQLIRILNVPAPLAAYPDLFQAQLAYEWNRLEEAKGAALLAIEKTAPVQYMDILVVAYDVLVRVQIAQHDLAGAELSIREMEQVSKHSDIPLFRPFIESLRVHLWLAQGNLRAASNWAEHTPYSQECHLYSSEIACLALARVYLAEQRFTRALQLLAALRSSAEQVARVGSSISILALQVAALQASGASQEALDALAHLLALAEPEGYIRVFLDAGEPMRQSLEAWLATSQQEHVSFALALYIRTLLDAFAHEQQRETGEEVISSSRALPPQTMPPLPDPLTPRELEVLHLLSQGATNQEIARRLVVSFATAKKHVASILSKLGAENRTEAVARARAHSLL